MNSIIVNDPRTAQRIAEAVRKGATVTQSSGKAIHIVYTGAY